jgi:hypothetical protein
MSLEIVDNGHGWAVLVNGRMETGGFDSERAAVDWWFDENRTWKTAKIGYPLAWITDGAIYCAKCAKEAWTEGGARRAELESGTIEAFLSQDSAPLDCTECNEWIVEPVCKDCGKRASDAGEDQFWHISGEPEFFCLDCLAKAVIARTHEHDAPFRAYKQGKRSYWLYERGLQTPGARIWDWVGEFTRPAFNGVELKIDSARRL